MSTPGHLVSSLLALLLLACSAPAEDATSSESALAQACSLGCHDRGTFALDVTGAGFEKLAGARVVASAIEPTTNPSDARPSVMLSDRIETDGTFELTCPKALSRNGGYPSYGVWIDVDGDGKCGPGDLGVASIFYAWSDDVKVATRPSGQSDGSSSGIAFEPVERVTGWDRPFCAYYGFPR